MTWTTVPGIEYEVFMAAFPCYQWKPRFPLMVDAVILGTRLSTLVAFKNIDGGVSFYSHDPEEIMHLHSDICKYFGVEIV